LILFNYQALLAEQAVSISDPLAVLNQQSNAYVQRFDHCPLQYSTRGSVQRLAHLSGKGLQVRQCAFIHSGCRSKPKGQRGPLLLQCGCSVIASAFTLLKFGTLEHTRDKLVKHLLCFPLDSGQFLINGRNPSAQRRTFRLC
jgi:hypothetical protein